ncbi:MAG: hypothetical protein OXL97_05930 [Chloroflexota bacterium]|nr:hypothetical protein [Chloroflexota bacterium]MDE2885142.1 hypothetical protein [Chloroflexota bacterium]
MSQIPFPVREGINRNEQLLPPEELPDHVREKLLADMRSIAEDALRFQDLLYEQMCPIIARVLNKTLPAQPQGGPFRYYVPKTVKECSWVDFYDICEVTHKCILASGYDANTFANDTNSYWGHYGIAWKYETGWVVRTRPDQTQQDIKKAFQLVSTPEYQSVNEQYAKAIGHLNRRPPDYENAVGDAVGAIERMAKIIAGQPNRVLSQLTTRPPLNGSVHRTLLAIIDKLYAYRGDQSEHGGVGKAAIGPAEAEFILATSANTIIYLASKFPAR